MKVSVEILDYLTEALRLKVRLAILAAPEKREDWEAAERKMKTLLDRAYPKNPAHPRKPAKRPPKSGNVTPETKRR